MPFDRYLLMESGRTLRNKTRLFSLGLSKEIIDQINQMIETGSQLKDNFSALIKSDQILSSDIIFINADNPSVMDLYAKHHSLVTAVPVFMHQPKSDEYLQSSFFEKYPNAKSLPLPISLGSLSTVLSDIVTFKKTSIQTKQTSQNKADRFKVLVVDDSFPVRKYLEGKLPALIAELDDGIDFDIQFAVSGKQAVAKVKQARGKYDMVFLDVMMEDINGYKVCKWIKQVKKSIEVVMLTSKSSPIDRIRANLSGSDNYISKPPSDDDLKKVLQVNSKFQRRKNSH